MFVDGMKRIRSSVAAHSALFLHVLVLAASLIFAGSLRASPNPVFIDWPTSITNAWQSTQVTYTNSTHPYGLAVSNINGGAPVTILSGTNGFAVTPNAGQQETNGTNYILLYFTPGTNSTITEPYTNTIQVALTNVTGPEPWGGATTNIDIIITPPPANNPVFTTNFVNTWPTTAGSNVATIGPHFDATNPANSPVLYPVPDVTNATAVYALFLSNSLGETACTVTNTMPGTNRTYLATSNGFGLIPGSWSGISPNYANVGTLNPALHPTNPWQGATNPAIQSAIYQTNNQAWIGLSIVPGTNPTTAVTNYIQLLAYNGNNASTANWTTNNIEIVVAPPQPGPPYLQVRFYNSSTNPPDQVYILPASTTYGAAGFGNGFWWSNSNGANTWTNWIATSNQWTVRLSDIGISGTNAEGKAYYAINTTNFPNAAWYLSYGGGAVSATNNARPAANATNSTWFGHEWTPFELTLSGNAADKCDTTYINEFSIPMVVRSLTNSFSNATNGIFPSNSTAFYQIGGWTNWTNPAAVAATLSNLVQNLTTTFPNAVITNSSGVAVMVAGPSSAAAGTLVAPLTTSPPFVSDAQNSFPTLGAYFSAVKAAQPARKAKIKDFIGATGATNGPTATNGANPVFFFYYDFDLEVTTNNALRLTGSLAVTNQPGGSGTFTTNATNLVLEIGADAGPNDNWASSAVYLAPTPANYVTAPVWVNLTNGQIDGTVTNVQAYSPYATSGLAGQSISITGSNLLDARQVAFSGSNNTLVPSPRIVATNDTNISAVVPFGAINGPIVVTTTNGSGISTTNTGNWFYVTGATNTAAFTGPVPGGGSAPVVSGFTPTNGAACAPVFTVAGDWFAIADGTGTGPTNASPVATDYYNSPFGTAVMGRIMGDLAAGFALGFINSDATNAHYTNAAYGDSPSGSWWGGNQYPAADANSASYSQVNSAPQFSQWGNLIHQATAVTYGHPIYDRMQFFSGTNFLQIQPSSATNNNPDVWVVEVEFFNGMASVGGGPSPGFLTYSNWLTNYPSITGTNTNANADPDGDGFINGNEYAFGGNPTVGTPALLATTSSPSNAVIGFIALSNASSNYTVLSTTNLTNGNSWSNYSATVTNAAPPFPIPLPDYYLGQAFTVPITPGTNMFFKVVFTNQ